MKRKFTPLKLEKVVLTSGLLGERQKLNEQVTVPIIYNKFNETGRIESLSCQWEEGQTNRPHPFWDSDIGKMIEAVAYSLATKPDEELEADMDKVIDLLENEQYPDGYLNSYFRTFGIEDRWTNLYYMHELYCAGHLMEGSVAYYEATGKKKFLDIMCRYADHIYDIFITKGEKARAYGGHPEIELALVRLYNSTKDEKYLELSKHFIDERGTLPYYFEQESLQRGVDTTKKANQKRHLKDYLKKQGPYAEYQSHKPVREQTEPVGHTVRAMYLYSGMADIAAAYDDEELYQACCTIWDSMVNTQYYITGGIGPSSDGERFTFGYDLPNEYTYNESCASVALVMWAHRMLQFECDSKYADIMEQTLYNTVLSSISNEGDKFFYANYLSVFPERFEQSSAAVIDKMRAERQEWFDIACCPPNVSRLMGSLGGYIYSQSNDCLYVHLYTENSSKFDSNGLNADITMSTQYPWNGDVKIAVDTEVESEFGIGLRIPGWCKNWSVKVNEKEVAYEMQKGYCIIRKAWKNDVIELKMVMEAIQVEANPNVRENCGRIALQRGPVVYCIEEADNGKGINDISIVNSSEIREKKGIPNVSEDAVVLEFDGLKRDTSNWSGELYRRAEDQQENISVKAIPYYLWANRGFGEMLVWILKK
jgi:hypothetical protein